ncbi:Brp/Blh family beta-carotene 15,15'-dioxygenase [Sphingomonas baiyangensis]|uniref:Beta-carotene 15,15'-dioxygenase n=1 Tax=Sphingomonas baiyangensis TaxID=2572576 RepID=A0A4U1L072_9SPHN|nr:Brp/Blh family beta-carotene 15,15'-dioxygenase [Sphingomonas baiyangensis]TKD50121.1 hypothetical protein FBR43_04630 [Sphingomonas baiyangensis]
MLALGGVAQAGGEASAVALGLLMFAAGMPHGAADDDGTTIRRFGLPHAAAYVVAAGAVAAFMLAAPLTGLTLFFLLSAWHFAHSGQGPAPRRWGIAMIAVAGSALWRPDETAAVLQTILGEPVPPWWLATLAAAGALGVVLALPALRTRPADATLWSALAAVLLFHPVLAAGMVFLVAHAVPVQQRQIERYGVAAVCAAVSPTTLAAVLGALALATLVATGMLALPVATALAFGMATPHMLGDRLAG